MKQDANIVRELREMYIDTVEGFARVMNQTSYLDDFTDEQLRTLGRVFEQLSNKVRHHRNGRK